MKSPSIAALLALLAAATPTLGQTPPQKPPQPPPQPPPHAPPPAKSPEIHGQGCIEPGIEPRCLIVKDLRSGKLYHLIVRGIQPALGEGIEFVGILHTGPTPCMQATPIDVTEWARKNELNYKAVAPRKR